MLAARKLGAVLSAGMMTILCAGCSAAPPPYRTPDHWQKTGYTWPGSTIDSSERAGAKTPSRPLAPVGDAERDASLVPPSAPIDAPDPLFGKACVRELETRGIRFVTLRKLKGVEVPVEVQGPLGGVTFWANDGRPLQMDCRLALALDQLRPVFESAGLTRVRYSGAYSYRTTRSGRLSHHAHGLAIDLHDFEFGSKSLSVIRDFSRNARCSRASSLLNRVSCDAEASSLFQEFLTPDDNRDHRDHLHLAVPRRDQLNAR